MNYFCLSLFLGVFTVLHAQDSIPFTLQVIDKHTAPAQGERLEQLLEAPEGAYFLHGNATFGPTEVSYFDGANYTVRYTTEGGAKLAGATENGVFLIEEVVDVTFGRRVVFVPRSVGAADTLNTRTLTIPETYMLGHRLLVFNRSRITAYTDDGQETDIWGEYSDCSCGQAKRFYPFGDGVVVHQQGKFTLTDGTSEGTRDVFSGNGTLYTYGNRLLHMSSAGIRSYDPAHRGVVQLLDTVPGRGEPIKSISDAVLTEHGVMVSGTTATGGKELFVTDGTLRGTRALNEINVGAQGSLYGWQERSFKAAVVPGYLVFRRPVAEGNDIEYWISDGSDAGTRFLFKPTLYGFSLPPSVRGANLPDGTLMLILDPVSSSSDSSVVLSVNTAHLALPILVTHLPHPVVSRDESVVGDRLLISQRRTWTQEPILYSFGKRAGDVRQLTGLDRDAKVVYHTATELYYVGHSDTIWESVVYGTHGVEDSLIAILPLVSNSTGVSDLGHLFRIEGSLYAYITNRGHGQSFYHIDPKTFTATFVTDAYDHNVGADVGTITSVGSHALWSAGRFGEGQGGFMSDGTAQGTVRIPTYRGLEDNPLLVGTHGTNRYLYGQYTNHYLTKLDVTTGIADSLTDSLFSDSKYWLGNPTMLGEAVYAVRSRTAYDYGNPTQYISELIRFDLVAERGQILASDTTTTFGFRGAITTVADDRHVYFGRPQGEGVGVSAYDSKSETIHDLGVLHTPGRPDLRKIGDLIVVEYSNPFFNGLSARFLSDGKLGAKLAVWWPRTSTGLTDCLVSHVYYNQTLYSTDARTGDSTAIFYSPDITIQRVDAVDASTAVFFGQNAERNWQVYFTDGTKAGTEYVGPLPGGVDATVRKVLRFGEYLAVMVSRRYGGDPLYLFSPASRTWQLVNDQLPFNASMAIVSDQLFFPARHPRYGEEVHVLTINTPSTTKAIAYHDRNGDGRLSPGEPLLPNVPITVSGQSRERRFTNREGAVILRRAADQPYTVTAGRVGCYEPLPGQDEHTITFPQGDTTLYLGYRLGGNVTALDVSVNAGSLRCNFEGPVWVTVKNEGCVPVAGSLTIQLPSNVSLVSASELVIPVTDTGLSFTLDTLSAGQARQVMLQLLMPDEQSTGQQMVIGAVAGGMTSEGSRVSDSTTFSTLLRCAYDPNDKQVWPARREPGNNNYTQLDELITYTVRFQNTGNDTAYTVRIEDQLSPHLDWSSLQPVAASHPYTTHLGEGGNLVFTLDRIMLPDSTTDLVASQGFVTFRVRTDSTLADFTVVSNTAAIYFDRNAPVITNTVRSTMVAQLDADGDGFNFYADCDDRNRAIHPAAEEVAGNGIDENCDGVDGTVSIDEVLAGELSIFPNPARSSVTVRATNPGTFSVNLTDVRGRSMIQLRFTEEISLTTSYYPPGVYTLIITDTNTGHRVTHRLVIR